MNAEGKTKYETPFSKQTPSVRERTEPSERWHTCLWSTERLRM